MRLAPSADELFGKAYDARGKWTTKPSAESTFTENERQSIRSVRAALTETGDEDPQGTFIVQKSSLKHPARFRLNPKVLGLPSVPDE